MLNKLCGSGQSVPRCCWLLPTRDTLPCLAPHLYRHLACTACTARLQDNFYMLDLGALQRLYRSWGEALPRVQPHYSVRCNPDPALLGTLAALGCGFDCASEAEIRAVSEWHCFGWPDRYS